jgi:hypothetical protein
MALSQASALPKFEKGPGDYSPFWNSSNDCCEKKNNATPSTLRTFGKRWSTLFGRKDRWLLDGSENSKRTAPQRFNRGHGNRGFSAKD